MLTFEYMCIVSYHLLLLQYKQVETPLKMKKRVGMALRKGMKQSRNVA